jgi:hypothetical protein
MPPDARTPPGLAPAGGALLNDPSRSVVEDGDRDNIQATPRDDDRSVESPALPIRERPVSPCRPRTREELVAAVDQAIIAQGGRPHGPRERRFRCPEREQHRHGDAHWSADWNVAKRCWVCRACGAGGGVVDLALRLGISLRIGVAGVSHGD